jgi:hypothetical protein
LRIKDIPSETTFAEWKPFHYGLFSALCDSMLKDYLSNTGALNLWALTPDEDVKADVGPKGYITHGGKEDEETGDPVSGCTNLHEDMCPAVNIAMTSGKSAGRRHVATWYIWHKKHRALVPPTHFPAGGSPRARRSRAATCESGACRCGRS